MTDNIKQLRPGKKISTKKMIQELSELNFFRGGEIYDLIESLDKDDKIQPISGGALPFNICGAKITRGENGLFIETGDGPKLISRQHAVVINKENEVTLMDFDSIKNYLTLIS